jgi:hypothetical protein
MLANGRRYGDWSAVTEWVRGQVGSRVRLIPLTAIVWRIDREATADYPVVEEQPSRSGETKPTVPRDEGGLAWLVDQWLVSGLWFDPPVDEPAGSALRALARVLSQRETSRYSTSGPRLVGCLHAPSQP